MPNDIRRLIQMPYPGNEVEMFDIDLTSVGGPPTYISNYVREDGSKIVWRGNEYEPVALQVTGYETSGEGRPARPKMTIGQGSVTIDESFSGSLTALAAQFKDFIGCTVTRWKTYRHFLDDSEVADPSAHLLTEKYIVSQKTAENAMYLEWELAMPLDQEGKLIPRGIMTQKHCQWTYRVWNPATETFNYDKVICPYAGGSMFDENGDPTLDPTEDKCSKRIDTGCRKRFGETAALPFGGFPGMRQLTGPN